MKHYRVMTKDKVCPKKRDFWSVPARIEYKGWLFGGGGGGDGRRRRLIDGSFSIKVNQALRKLVTDNRSRERAHTAVISGRLSFESDSSFSRHMRALAATGFTSLLPLHDHQSIKLAKSSYRVEGERTYHRICRFQSKQCTCESCWRLPVWLE